MLALAALRSPHLPYPSSPKGRGGVKEEARGLQVRPAEAGYNMVVLIVAITVLNVLVAAMLPLWSTQIRREKEEELIFRGFQYAEAIRVCQSPTRLGTYPMKLEQLIKVKPRCIRQLWKDPMTEDGQWGLIFAGPGEEIRGPQGGRQGQKDEGPSGEDENGRESQTGPKEGETVQVGPIIGVHSKSNEKSMIVLFGRERYNEWKFTVALLTGGGGERIQGGAGGAITGIAPGGDLKFSTRWIGRPSRFENQTPVPQDGTMPDGTRRDGGGTRNRRPPPTKP